VPIAASADVRAKTPTGVPLPASADARQKTPTGAPITTGADARPKSPTGAPITIGADAPRARSTTGAPLSADPNALQFAKVAGEALARADAKIQEAAHRSAAAEEAKAYAARVKAAAAAKRAQEAGVPAPAATDAAAPPDRKSLDADGLVQQIISEGPSGGALSAGTLVAAAGVPLRPRLLEDTEGFVPVDLSNDDANIGGEHVIVRPSIANLQQAAAAGMGAGTQPTGPDTATPTSGATAVPVAGVTGTTEPGGSAEIVGSTGGG